MNSDWNPAERFFADHVRSGLGRFCPGPGHDRTAIWNRGRRRRPL